MQRREGGAEVAAPPAAASLHWRLHVGPTQAVGRCVGQSGGVQVAAVWGRPPGGVRVALQQRWGGVGAV